MMGKTTLISLAIVVTAVAGVLIWWLTHQPGPPPDCSFTGWKRTVGVDLETQVKELDTVKGNLGISDSMVRDYDNLTKDYALKYDAACQDFQHGRISQGEYSCRRKNMDRVLDEIRKFVQAVEASKSISDAAGQKQAVLKAIETLHTASSTDYRFDCSSSLNVNPKTISFTGHDSTKWVEVTNGGNSDFSFSLDETPSAFRFRPPGGFLKHDPAVGVAEIIIERSYEPVPEDPMKFLVRTNLNDVQEIKILVDTENRVFWQREPVIGRPMAGARLEPMKAGTAHPPATSMPKQSANAESLTKGNEGPRDSSTGQVQRQRGKSQALPNSKQVSRTPEGAGNARNERVSSGTRYPE